MSKVLKAHVNGVDLSYQIFGSGSQNLIFIHGYAVQSTGELYTPLYDFLAPHFRIFALDIRGHGASSGVVENFTLDHVVLDIIAFCETLKLQKPLFVGHSLGGVLGLLCELRNPDFFGGLVLLNPAAANGAEGASKEVLKRALRDHHNKEAMLNNYRSMFVRDVSDKDLNQIVDMACLVDKAVHKRYLCVEFPNLNISNKLHLIATPSLFLNGSKDNVIPLHAQHDTAMKLVNFKEIIFSDEGHMLPLESPQRTSVEIINFYVNDLNI